MALGRVSLGESQLIAEADILYVLALCVCMCSAMFCGTSCKSNATWQCCAAFELYLSSSKIAHGSVDRSLSFQKHTTRREDQNGSVADISAALLLQSVCNS